VQSLVCHVELALKGSQARFNVSMRKWIIWGSGLAFTLIIFAAFNVMRLGMEEYLCFDRRPWWGPPTGEYTTCAGHMWELHEAGYDWFGLFVTSLFSLPGPK
jgi:hypothetical protein